MNRHPAARHSCAVPAPVALALAALAALAAAPTSALAQSTAPFADRLVQAPKLERPGPASLAGDLATFSVGAESLDGGGFQLSMPWTLPRERAPLLASVVPSYRPGAGLSEWGMGWSLDLSIRRSRRIGEIDYTDADELISPWGRLVRGDDGALYPVGLSSPVRVERAANGFVGTDAKGSRFAFALAHQLPGGTHSWSLVRVDGVHGETTTLTWQQNDTGRPFLTRVEWGRGRAEYALDLAYETLPRAFVDYRAGARVELDRRVRRATVLARNADTGGFEPRLAYDLRYETDPFGLASYLVSVTTVHRSGHSPPPVTYDYATVDDTLDAASFAVNQPLQRYVSLAGASALEPGTVAVADIDRDGRSDLEHFYARVLVRQGDAGFALEALPPAPPSTPTPCGRKPSYLNRPRTLVRLHPDDAEPVVVAPLVASPGSTELFMCDRAGALRDLVTLDGQWQLDAMTRLADLDADRRPDLIRVFGGGYEILRNVSSADAVAFQSVGRQALSSAAVTTTWIHDMNGDSMPDLVGLTSAGLIVWHGQGQLRFGPGGLMLPLISLSGLPIADVDRHSVTYLDVNHDGLTDALLSRSGAFFLFMNRGDRLVEHRLPAALLGQLASFYGTPFIGDLDGSGETQVSIVVNRVPYTARLGSAEVGLMTAADDGKGSRTAFRFGRPPARPGLEGRGPVLAGAVTARSGRGEVDSQFRYDAPALHSELDLLLGFGAVTEIARGGTTDVRFSHDDDLGGVVTSVVERDPRMGALARYETTQHQLASYRGLKLRRPTRTETGWRDASGATGTVKLVEQLGFDRGVCAVETRTTRDGATLVVTDTLASPSALSGALHCLSATSSLRAVHVDPTADFAYALEVARNSAGDIVELAMTHAGERVVLQHVTYDTEGRITAVERPGLGVSRISYDAAGRIVSSQVPSGILETAEQLDGVTDAIAALHLDRGGTGMTSWFRYDGLDRLAAEWDEVTDTSATDPRVSYAYQYASADRLATLRTQARVAAHSAARVMKLQTADGEPVTEANLGPDGWAVGAISQRDDGAGTTSTWRVDALPASMTAPSLADMLAFGDLVANKITASTGQELAADQAFGDGVWGETAWRYRIEAGRLVIEEIANQTDTRTTALDVDGKATLLSDELGRTTRLDYDALGRVRRVTLASGATHTIDFDGFGRTRRIARDGVGAVTYDYDRFGLLAEERWGDAAGAVVRTVHYERDAIGRPLEVMHRAANGESERVSYSYDGGRLDAGIPLADQRGELTQVDAGVYRRLRRIDQRGRVTTEVIEIEGWRRVEIDTSYYDDDEVRRAAVVVRDSEDNLVSEMVQETLRDAYGRISEVQVNGETTVRVTYDASGRVALAALADGSLMTFDYDATTRELRERALQHSEGWRAATSATFDQRGRIGRETLDVAGTSDERRYEHDAAGQLLAVRGATTAQYDYDLDGMPVEHADLLGERSLDRASGQTIGQQVEFDAMGRVIRLGDAALRWSPRGDLAEVERGGQTWTYAYDEAGQRVARLRDGVPERGFVNGMLVTEHHLMARISVGPTLVGLAVDGVLVPLATDARGSVIGGQRGLSAPTPYGVRVAGAGPLGDLALDDALLSEAIDYVEAGRDDILGTIRLGVRDYAPTLGQFLTFDPLYFAEPARCADKPRECNLFGYASGDPLTFVDPEGTDPVAATKAPARLEPVTITASRPTTTTLPTTHIRLTDSKLTLDPIHVTSAGDTIEAIPSLEFKPPDFVFFEAKGALLGAEWGITVKASPSVKVSPSGIRPLKLSVEVAYLIGKVEAAVEFVGSAKAWERALRFDPSRMDYPNPHGSQYGGIPMGAGKL